MKYKKYCLKMGNVSNKISSQYLNIRNQNKNEILEDYVTDTVGSYEIYQEFLEERHANDWIDN